MGYFEVLIPSFFWKGTKVLATLTEIRFEVFFGQAIHPLK
jgi:hypothetical protein